VKDKIKISQDIHKRHNTIQNNRVMSTTKMSYLKQYHLLLISYNTKIKYTKHGMYKDAKN